MIFSRQKIYSLLRWSEKYTKTDMVYLASGGFWLSFGQVIFSAASFALALAFANLLPKETFGQYKYVITVFSLLSIPALKGMETAIIQAVARRYEGSIISALKTKIKWGLLGSLASLGLAVYYLISNNNALAISFFIVALFVPLMNSFLIYESFLKGRKLFKKATALSVFIKISATITIIASLFITKNLFLIIFIYFASLTLFQVASFVFALKKYQPNKEKDKQTISYGKHLSVVRILTTIGDELDKILIWHYLGAIQLAVYSFALAPIVQIRKVFKNITSLALPKFAERSISEIKQAIAKKLLFFFLLMAVIVFCYILAAPFLFSLAFPKYMDSVFYSQIFALILLLKPTDLARTILTAHARKKDIYFLTCATFISRITLLFILTPFYGIIGVISALLSAKLINLMLLIFLLKKI